MTRFGKFGVLLGALLAFTLLASGLAGAASSQKGGSTQMDDMNDMDMMQMMDEAMTDLEDLEGEEFEVEYVNQIIPHHQGALEMAQAVVDRAPNQEVRDAAARVIEDQNREIEELTTFLRDTYDQEVQPDERMAMMPSMIEEMNSADPATAEKMFLLGMREHHQSAIEMGEMALEKAQSDTILTQAENMVSSQQAEQEEFAGYLQTFYDIEAPEPTGDMEQSMSLAMSSGSSSSLPKSGGMSVGSLSSVAVLASALLVAATLVGGFALRRETGR